MNIVALLGRALLGAALLAVALVAAAQQPAWPAKPVRLVVPYPPGGGTSIVAHLLSERLAERWGHTLVVDNRGGAGGIIGTNAMLAQPADGYTFLLASTTHVVNPLLLQVPYDPIEDFSPVTTLYSSELLLVAYPGLGVKNLQEFIALAKSQPGKLNYGVVSVGGTTHLAGEMLNMLAGIRTQHVAYKGAGPAMQDLVGGRVQFSFVAPAAAMSFVKQGQLLPIAVSGKHRLQALPDVPTFEEAGLREFQSRVWFGILAKNGTPRAVVDKLARDLNDVMALPEMKQKLAAQGQEPFPGTPDDFAALMKADLARYAELVKTAKIKLEQ